MEGEVVADEAADQQAASIQDDWPGRRDEVTVDRAVATESDSTGVNPNRQPPGIGRRAEVAPDGELFRERELDRADDLNPAALVQIELLKVIACRQRRAG